MEFEDTSEKPVKLKGRVKMSLRAQLPEELDLYAGDVIDITHIVDKDWYRGESNGATGIFPSGFVEILETDSVPSPSLPSQEINLPHECPSIDYTNSGGSYFAEETRPSFSSTADYFDIVDHVTLDHDQINAKPSMTPTSISEVTPVLSRTSTHWKTIDAVDDVDLLEDEYFKQNMPGLFASSSANKTTLSLHNNTKTIIPPVSSYDNIKPVIPPLSQASASDSFTKVKPRYENVIDSTSIEIGLRDSSSSFPDSYTCIANSENASPVANSNIKSRYENVENSPSIFTSNIQECALSMNQDVTSGDVLNSLSQKVEDYFASNLINNNSETSNTELDCKSHLLKQYSTLSSPGYNEDNTGIEPYGRAVFSFSAQYPNELTFKKGDIIHLLKHIDSHWTLGKLGDSRGIFPTSYVDVIVDCQHQYVEEELFLARCDSVAHPSYLGHAKAVYSFEGDQTGDVSMSKGDILKVLRSVDDNWAFVENMNGSKGMCPKNYLSMLIDMTADQNNVMSQSDESCSRLSRQLVQDPPSSRSRSTSPYDTSGSRRSYSKDDFGIIKKQEVDSVLAKNIASLDIATRGCHTDKREKESVFAEREANEQVLDDKPMTSPSNKTNNAFHTKPPLIDRTLSLPPVPPRNKIRREISIQPQSNSNGSTRSTLGASGKEPSCEVSDEPIYSKVQKPLQLGASTKVRLQDKPSLEFSINRTSMTRGDSSNSAAFPDDVSTLSNEKTYSSVVHNGSTSPAVLPQRPAPPPPPKIGDATYEEIEEYYSLPAKDEIKEGDRVLQAESSSLQQVVSTSIVTNNENMSVPLEDGAANNTESETSGINIESEVKACAKVDIRRELMQEIVTTEHEYIHDLEALIQVIRLAPSQKESQAVDLDTLMGNLTQVVSIAKKLLSHLDHVAYESDDSLRIGRVFLLCASDLCEVYKIYCSNHNVAAEPLLRKEPTAAAFLQWVLSELQQHKIQLMDMRSVLIKPVQRVLK
ncbi:hypothetical protein SK128_028511 [Halocaridina rubra]|uniref:SH3 domain-containing protein 19 n=1 Tax=Halocaridina rubra TaxID=373956 RepID=A0AAN8XHR9_HALRR